MNNNTNLNQVVQINVPMPNMPRMSALEQLGIEAALAEVQRSFEPIYGQIPHPLHGTAFLRTAIYWALREIDTLQQQGHTLQTIQQSEQLLRQVVRASSAGSQNPNEPPIVYENRAFPAQVLYLNLAMFLIRYLMRNMNNQLLQVNNNINNNPNAC